LRACLAVSSNAWCKPESQKRRAVPDAGQIAIYLRYIASMFEVLAFVYQNYYTGEARPEPAYLQRKLNAVGFGSEEIDDALQWLSGLQSAANIAQPEPWLIQPDPLSIRIFPTHEQSHLGTRAVGFIHFLESAGVLPAHMREVVIDRAMAAPGGPIALDDLKIIVLMVYWTFGQEPDALVLDELCEDAHTRVAH
jgi:Smg protein